MEFLIIMAKMRKAPYRLHDWKRRGGKGKSFASFSKADQFTTSYAEIQNLDGYGFPKGENYSYSIVTVDWEDLKPDKRIGKQVMKQLRLSKEEYEALPYWSRLSTWSSMAGYDESGTVRTYTEALEMVLNN